jgi:hypothetical protein
VARDARIYALARALVVLVYCREDPECGGS